ncbi:hypothetical protein [Terrisporobacter petrolearius]|uniref:Uncharacterized protein n=1 Tax=Terrisporobacter petrolearius TaxID=1460447 RepID=A0ABZ3FBZ1_9FIRM
MMKYRISKYNPKYRDENGIYTRDEWTSISDIGEYFNGYEVTMKEYSDIENRYVEAIDIILEYFKIKYLYIMELENEENIVNDIDDDFCQNDIDMIDFIKEGQELNIKEIKYVIRLTLRERFWCGLYSKTTHIIIKPGYDFYINIISPELPQYIINRINELGIYLEKINNICD